MSSIMRWRNGLMGLSDIAKAPVSHGVEPHDLETGSGLRLRLQPMARSPSRSPLLPRERFSPWAESGHRVAGVQRRRRGSRRGDARRSWRPHFCFTLPRHRVLVSRKQNSAAVPGRAGGSIRFHFPLGQPRLAQAFDDARVFALKLRIVRPLDVRPGLHGEARLQLEQAGDRGLGLFIMAEPAIGGGEIDIGEPGHCQTKFYTASWRSSAGGKPTVFAEESPTRST